MVVAGTLVVKGKLDITDIQRGQRRINTGFEAMNQKSKSTLSSMSLLEKTTKSLGNSLNTISTVVASGLGGLAALAPQLAPEFAKIKVETFKLALIMGEKLKPILGEVSDAYASFVGFLGTDTKLAEFTKDVFVLAGAGGALALLLSKLGLIKGLGKIVIPIAIATAANDPIEEFLKSPIEKGLTSLTGEREQTNMVKSNEEIAGNLSKLIANLATFTAAGAAGGALVGGVGAIPGALGGAIGGAGYTIYEIVKEDFFNDVDASGR